MISPGIGRPILVQARRGDSSRGLAVNNSLVAEVVAQFGTTAQRATWLRRLATGQTVDAFALSEPDAGTDAANQHTTATLDGGGYRLNGRRDEGTHRRCVTEEQRRPEGMPRLGIMWRPSELGHSCPGFAVNQSSSANRAKIGVSLFSVCGGSSGTTRVDPTTVMKLVSPSQRGTR